MSVRAIQKASRVTSDMIFFLLFSLRHIIIINDNRLFFYFYLIKKINKDILSKFVNTDLGE